VYNAADTIGDCIRSVSGQSYDDIEHIIIDGGSTDGTVEKIQEQANGHVVWVSEKDKGFYDALNKGLVMARGDVVGTLNADDIYANQQVLQKVAGALEKSGADSCYGDLLYVNPRDTSRTIRYWVAGAYAVGQFQRGWMPPHPTFFVRREIYEKYGGFNTDFRIAADYELMLRFLEKHRISTVYIPEVLIKMRWGGTSNRSLGNLARKSYEDYLAWQVNGLDGGFSSILLKNAVKIPQFFRKYPNL